MRNRMHSWTSKEHKSRKDELNGRFQSFGVQVNLEPEKGQVWARGLSLIAPNTVAYAYQDASILDL